MKLLSSVLLVGSLLQVDGFVPMALRRTPASVPGAASRQGVQAASVFKTSRVADLSSLRSPRLVLSSTAEAGDSGGPIVIPPDEPAAVVPVGNEPVPSPWYKDPVGAAKRWWGGAKMDRAQLAALGASALCSYGLVSNLNYCGSMVAAFVIFAKRNGVSPFGSGRWKEFLAIYGGLWAAMNFLRPVRFWISVGLTPYFDKIVETIAQKTGVKRPVAFGITVFLVNVCGTLTFLSSGLLLASYFTKVPLLAPKVPIA